MNLTRRYFPSLLWLLVTIMFLLGPIAVGKMGAYMRYVGDDYCYSSALKSDGYFLGQINSFQMVQRFNGDRYSLTLISFTTELFGPKGNAAAVAVMLVLWLGGLSMVAYQLLRILGIERAWGPSLAITSVVTFLFCSPPHTCSLRCTGSVRCTRILLQWLPLCGYPQQF